MGLTEILAGLLGGQNAGMGAGLGAGAGGGQAQLLNMILSMLANGSQTGGLDGLLRQLRDAGLGAQADSWVSTGQNLPVSPDQLRGAFGDARMDDLAARMGLSTGDLGTQMSQMLPEVVDRLTPQGRVPDGGLGGLDDLLGSLLGRH